MNTIYLYIKLREDKKIKTWKKIIKNKKNQQIYLFHIFRIIKENYLMKKKFLNLENKKLSAKIKETKFKKDNLKDYEKRLIVLDEMNTSNSSDNEYEPSETENNNKKQKIEKNENKNDYSVSQTSFKTGDKSSSSFC